METNEEQETTTVKAPTVEPQNWMLVLVCGVIALTALWEAVSAGRMGVWLDVAGYGTLALGGALFGLQTLLTPRKSPVADRVQAPAVYLALAGIVMLIISNASGRRL